MDFGAGSVAHEWFFFVFFFHQPVNSPVLTQFLHALVKGGWVKISKLSGPPVVSTLTFRLLSLTHLPQSLVL